MSQMLRTQWNARLEKIRALTPSVNEFSFQVELENFQFLAGQFVTLHVPQAGPKPALRAYSIASSQDDPHLKLIVKMVPQGVASQYLIKLKNHDRVQMTGPFGRCLFIEPPLQQICFVCTGAGLSQHYCFLKSKAIKFPDRRYRMLMGVWNESEIFYQSELSEIKKQLSDFKFDFVLDKPTGNWSGKTGYVTDYLDQLDFAKIPTHFYLCGNPEMIKSVKHHLIQLRAYDKKLVLSEAFY